MRSEPPDHAGIVRVWGRKTTSPSYICIVTNGSESWKSKCGIRRKEDVAPMTDGGTLIMRGDASSSHRGERKIFGETRQYNAPSIAPFAIDLPLDPEDFEEPARNSDAFGSVRRTQNIDFGRTTSNASFWSGLVAGLATLGVGIALGFTAFTTDFATASSGRRETHSVEHMRSSLSVDAVELVEAKAAPPKKKHRARRVLVATGDEAAAPEPLPAPEPSETE